MKAQRLFLVADILKRKTNIEKGMSISDIINILERDYNMRADRSTISSDVLYLQEQIGLNIIKKNEAHNKAYYYFEHEFSVNDMRLLLDSLGANKFVPNTYKREVSKKLLGLMSLDEERKLKNYAKVRTLADSEVDSIVYTLQKLHEAIDEKKEVYFGYKRYNLKKEMESTGKEYVVTPQDIYYFNERYYLIAYKGEEKRNFRIDRITSLRVGDYYGKSNKIDLERYDLINFDMFGVEKEEIIQLRIDNSLLDSVIERFGKNVNIKPEFTGSQNFILTERVGINKGLVRWILKQGSKAKVLAPNSLRQMVIEEINKIAQLYD